MDELRHDIVIAGLVACALLGLAGSVCAQTDLPIYTDSLTNGWQNWSWATVNVNNTSPTHSGSRSISVAAAAY